MIDLPPPPDEPTCGRSCDGGNCNAPSTAWRWFYDLVEWLPVCRKHTYSGVTKPANLKYDDPQEPTHDH